MGVDRDIEVGRGKVQAISLGGEQNVREDWDRGAALDDSLDQLEFLEHGRAVEGHVHMLVS